MLTALLGWVLAWLLPGGGTRRRAFTVTEPGPVAPQAPRVRPRSPYAREAAADYRVDVSDEPLTRPYYRHYRYCGATESVCVG
ncbi:MULTISPECIES: hypothetical protein [Streptomyces]|uniref:hypothetical protein n=1 Tax=Streptomyces TaxID=1883 RepID=UPI001D09C95D|nr:hypothetical protein [Streptomyces longhuiensis]UDM00549.1 hypothetical protein LGI35_20835 [Streptomyces longhuiensis]